ncbi:RES domain-containing protein [Herbaspirillum sp. HC18]|nr:RES domain-containing protein [Herbaspirillum sp. HC18]
MTVALWRIAVEAPTYTANDMTGTGAKLTGGRWNNPGTPMVYTSANIALATLETLSYLRTSSLPFNRYLVRIDVPDDVWALLEVLDPLPGRWDAIPSGFTSRKTGDDWIASRRSPLLAVPSVIVPDEQNILINPVHPETPKIIARTLKRWTFDPRFF